MEIFFFRFEAGPATVHHIYLAHFHKHWTVKSCDGKQMLFLEQRKTNVNSMVGLGGNEIWRYILEEYFNICRTIRRIF
jgi:tRNA A22 N-methylase